MATILGAALGLLSLAHLVEAKKMQCPPCKKRKRGKCKAKANGAACRGGACQGGRCVPLCPVCPVCQSCDMATGRCGVQPNGLAGQACAAPKVCCGGACCDPIHACNSAGACATCAAVCPNTCNFCFTLADGGTACADQGFCDPGDTCATAADCDPGEVCATSQTDRSSNATRQDCGQPVGSGVCYTLNPCD